MNGRCPYCGMYKKRPTPEVAKDAYQCKRCNAVYDRTTGKVLDRTTGKPIKNQPE